MIIILIEDREMITSLDKNRPSRGGGANGKNRKGNNHNYGQADVWYYGSAVDRGSCGAAAAGQDRKYGIGPVGGYVAVGGRVCDRHQISLV